MRNRVTAGKLRLGLSSRRGIIASPSPEIRLILACSRGLLVLTAPGVASIVKASFFRKLRRRGTGGRCPERPPGFGSASAHAGAGGNPVPDPQRAASPPD